MIKSCNCCPLLWNLDFFGCVRFSWLFSYYNVVEADIIGKYSSEFDHRVTMFHCHDKLC